MKRTTPACVGVGHPNRRKRSHTRSLAAFEAAAHKHWAHGSLASRCSKVPLRNEAPLRLSAPLLTYTAASGKPLADVQRRLDGC